MSVILLLVIGYFFQALIHFVTKYCGKKVVLEEGTLLMQSGKQIFVLFCLFSAAPNANV